MMLLGLGQVTGFHVNVLHRLDLNAEPVETARWRSGKEVPVSGFRGNHPLVTTVVPGEQCVLVAALTVE